MSFWRKRKVNVTGVSFPVIGGGVNWEVEADERKVRAKSERADAFTELWTIAQNAHIGVRNNFDDVDTLAAVHRQLNVLLIQKGPALDPADVELAQAFLHALEVFIRMLRPVSGEAADRVRGEVATTAARPRFTADLNELEASYSRVIYYNESLKRRYREVVFGESS